MKINKRLLISNTDMLLVSEDINLALNWAGKASFVISSPKAVSGLVKYQAGIGSYDTMHNIFIGVVDNCIELATNKWQVIAREYTAVFDGPNPINLRHTTLIDVLNQITETMGVTFTTTESEYTKTKIPYFYHKGTATEQLQAIGMAFSIPNYTWYLNNKGVCFVGSYEDSFWFDKSIEIAAHQAIVIDAKTLKIPLLPALRPGVSINGNKITQLNIKGSYMVATW